MKVIKRAYTWKSFRMFRMYRPSLYDGYVEEGEFLSKISKDRRWIYMNF